MIFSPASAAALAGAVRWWQAVLGCAAIGITYRHGAVALELPYAPDAHQLAAWEKKLLFRRRSKSFGLATGPPGEVEERQQASA